MAIARELQQHNKNRCGIVWSSMDVLQIMCGCAIRGDTENGTMMSRQQTPLCTTQWADCIRRNLTPDVSQMPRKVTHKRTSIWQETAGKNTQQVCASFGERVVSTHHFPQKHMHRSILAYSNFHDHQQCFFAKITTRERISNMQVKKLRAS